jgi:putative hemolysin
LEHIHQGKDFQWQKLIREALHTPETKKIDDLLREFQETRKHLAIVVDEFGGTSGIVTLEDIVEEVIGDINDESDESADSQLRKNPDGSYIVEGIMQLGDLAKGLELENDYFEEAKGDAETVGGLVVELFGRIPKVGEEVALHHFNFKVLSFKKNRIEKLKIFNNTPQS